MMYVNDGLNHTDIVKCSLLLIFCILYVLLIINNRGHRTLIVFDVFTFDGIILPHFQSMTINIQEYIKKLDQVFPNVNTSIKEP